MMYHVSFFSKKKIKKEEEREALHHSANVILTQITNFKKWRAKLWRGLVC